MTKIIDQFKLIKEQQRAAKKKSDERRAKGPVDVKETRRLVKEWNQKNRTPG